jgi:hypothetical protein
LRELVELEDNKDDYYKLRVAEMEYDSKYSVYYESLKDYDNFALCANVIYTIKRTLFVVLAYYFHDNVAIQLMGNALLT